MPEFVETAFLIFAISVSILVTLEVKAVIKFLIAVSALSSSVLRLFIAIETWLSVA